MTLRWREANTLFPHDSLTPKKTDRAVLHPSSRCSLLLTVLAVLVAASAGCGQPDTGITPTPTSSR